MTESQRHQFEHLAERVRTLILNASPGEPAILSTHPEPEPAVLLFAVGQAAEHLYNVVISSGNGLKWGTANASPKSLDDPPEAKH